ncbi:host attachment family protein [Erythrobacter insulae]|nr:host attachment family protein [Erythrobacter insulae]
MIPHGTYILALDGRQMLLFRNKGDVRQPVLATILHERAENHRSSVQGSDRPGRSFSSLGSRRSAMSGADLHEEAEKSFVARAAKNLEKAVHGKDARLIVLAAPSALGEIRKHIAAKLKDSIVAEIDRDVVNKPADDIVSVIDAFER